MSSICQRIYESIERSKRKENEVSLHPWFDWAKGEIGQKEIKGGENPRILWYGQFVDLDISEDEVPWCSCFANAAIQFGGGLKGTRSAVARSWLDWSGGKIIQLKDAIPSDLIIFQRGDSSWQGHVAFVNKPYDGSGYVEVLGGNQSDSVSIAKYAANKVLGIRRPIIL